MKLRQTAGLKGSLIVVAWLCLTGCAASPVVSAPTPTTLPPGLSIEEYVLEAGPQVEPLSFTPRDATQAEVLSKHQAERDTHFPDWTYSHGEWVARGDDQLKARAVETGAEYLENGQSVYQTVAITIEVSRQDTVIHSVPLSPTGAIPPIWGLWAYADHWALEVAHVTLIKTPPNIIDSIEFGEIIQDGVALNPHNGYEESFGFQLLNGKPFYFFKKQGRLGISYDGQAIDLGYSDILYHGCCSAGALNPQSAENMVAFFTQRAGVWYYVEIGVFGNLPTPSTTVRSTTPDAAGLTWRECALDVENDPWQAEKCFGQSAPNAFGDNSERTNFSTSYATDDLRLTIGSEVYETAHRAGVLPNQDCFTLQHGAEKLTTLCGQFTSHSPNILLENIQGKVAWEFADHRLDTIVYDGQDLRQVYALDAAYRPYQLNGKLIFVGKKAGKYFVVYDGQKIGPDFDEISIAYCCEPVLWSVQFGQGRYVFWGSRDKQSYVVEINAVAR